MGKKLLSEAFRLVTSRLVTRKGPFVEQSRRGAGVLHEGVPPSTTSDKNEEQRIGSIMSSKSLKPETFQKSINSCLKNNNVDGAYNMLKNMKSFDLTPDSSLYNSIMAGYFREKKWKLAHKIFEEMKEANVEPDSTTFSYLINYSNSETLIGKYYEQMKEAGLRADTRVHMSLIKAYTLRKKFEKAKHVLKDVSAQDQNQVKSYLISALARNGKIKDAFTMYEEMKKSGCFVESKSIISLIENAHSNTELRKLVELVHELGGDIFWIEGVFKLTMFAIRNNQTSSIIGLLKQTIKCQWPKHKIRVEFGLIEVFVSIGETESSPNAVKLGLELVRFMKEEFGFPPPRKCLDFLLQACVNAKEKENAMLVWREYELANLPHNVLGYLRMYQVLVSVGDWERAKEIRSKLPNDDDVNIVVEKSVVLFTPK